MTQSPASYIQNDRYANSLGVQLITQDEESVTCALEVKNEHKNGLGSVHGAVIFALADIAFASACNAHQLAIGMQADIRYLNKPQGENLSARAKLISGSKRISHYEVSIFDNIGTDVAVFTGTAYQFPDR
jgi:acyl-CoA thioesterase